MENKIQKPVSVARIEFINAITNLINTSGLQPFIIEPILKDMFTEVKNATQQQYIKELEEYNKVAKMNQEDSCAE